MQRLEIRFPSTHEGLAQGSERLRAALDVERLNGTPRYNAELVFEEIVANILEHGAVDDRVLDVRVTLETHHDAIILTFDDNGVPFDPRGRADPLPATSLEEARVGGFGLMLVRHAVSSLNYLRTTSGRNQLTVKVLREAPSEG
jgi:serine/threonine-protein kinase RsbW